MTNPYEPPRFDQSKTMHRPVSDLHRFAGLWLVVAGLIHLVAINTLPEISSMSSIDWSPAVLILLGLLVLRAYRIAISLTRFIGWSLIVGLLLIPFLVFLGGEAAAVTYGRIQVKDAAPWQVALMLLFFAATFLPPWWALQRELESEMKNELGE